MAEHVKRIYDGFWSSSYWLPPGTTWKDANPELWQDIKYYPFLIAACLVLLKYRILKPLVFQPVAKYFKIKSKPHRKPAENPKLEHMYMKYKSKVPDSIIQKVSVDLGWNERQVERWLRLRYLCEQSTTYEKFEDCSWQLMYYICYCIYGMVVHYDKPWLYDIRLAWEGYPNHDTPPDLWLYMMVASGFYWSQTFTHPIQPKKKDSKQLLLHHVIMLTIFHFGLTLNFVRLGSLVILVHEVADIPLLLGKILGYCKLKNGLHYSLHGAFVVLWIITRLIIFPLYILKFTLWDIPSLYGNTNYPAFHGLNALHIFLLVIHFIWTVAIVKSVNTTFTENKLRNVQTSDDSSETSEEDFDKDYPKTTKGRSFQQLKAKRNRVATLAWYPSE